MTKYDDATIPIACTLCPELDWEKEIGCAYGIDNLIKHLYEFHGDQYSTIREATTQAEKWMEKAYDREDEEAEFYAISRKEDPSE